MFFATLICKQALLSHTKMNIRIDVDEHIDSSEELIVRVEGVVEGSLDGYQEQVSRVDVRLSRRIPNRPGEHDMGCRMEAHLGAHHCISVSHEAMTLTEAIHAAAAKLERGVQGALRTAGSSSAGRGEVTDGMPDQAEGLEHLRSS